MKKIGKYPIEVFCCDFENHSEATELAFKQQYCKYIKGTCVKPRGSVSLSVSEASSLKPVDLR